MQWFSVSEIYRYFVIDAEISGNWIIDGYALKFYIVKMADYDTEGIMHPTSVISHVEFATILIFIFF